MRRRRLAFVALAALLSACTENDSRLERTQTTSAFDVDNVTPTTKSQPSLCYSSAARTISAGYATALQPGADVAGAIAGLRQAQDVAPEELLEEFRVVLGAQIPFLELILRANGNLAGAARDPAFRDALARVSAPAVVQASGAITTWVTQHCSSPR